MERPIIDKMNIFFKNNDDDDTMIMALNDIYIAPYIVQLGKLPPYMESEKQKTIIKCNHEYVKFSEQTRSSDEMITVFWQCKKCLKYYY